MSKYIKEQLRQIKIHDSRVNPDPAWVLENKQRLFARIKTAELIPVRKEIPFFLVFKEQVKRIVLAVLPTRLSGYARPIVTGTMVLFLTASGWITSASAANSLPGDLLYSVKRAAEDIHVAVSVTGQQKAKVHLDNAARRSEEVVRVLTEKKSEPQVEQLAEKTLQDIGKSIDSAKASVQDIDATKKVAAVQDLVETTSAIKKTLKEAEEKTKETNKDTASTLDEGIAKTAGEATGAALTAIEELVALQASGGNVVEQEVKNVVQGFAEIMLEDASAVVDDPQVKEIAEKVDQAIKDGGITVVPTKTVGSATSTSTTTTQPTTPMLPNPIVTATGTINIAEGFVENVAKKVDETKQKAAELRDGLTQTKSLTEVIQQVKQLAEAKQAVTDVKQIAENALPKDAGSTAITAPIAPPVPSAIAPTTTTVPTSLVPQTTIPSVDLKNGG